MSGIFRRFRERINRRQDKEQFKLTAAEENQNSHEAAQPSVAVKSIQVEPPQLIVGCGRSNGLQRDHNEDALFTLTTNLVSDSRYIPFGLYIVADGMGGHLHGEIASALAVRTMSDLVIRKFYLPLLNSPDKSPEGSLRETMNEAMQEAHQVVMKKAPGSGTTLTAALILGEQLMVAHAGDSRAYLIPSDGEPQALTRDHSLVKRLEELGQITPDEAALHPQRNVLYRALGQGELFEPDIITSPLPPDGFLLICSDGLWGVVEEKEMLNLIKTSLTPVEACQRLILAANNAGGPDNITAILIRLPERVILD